MAHIIIADAGPLIAFAGTCNLQLLQQLFGQVWITCSVERECLAKPGQDAERIAKAIKEGWLLVKTMPESETLMPDALGAGERDSIKLALQSPKSSLLIMDDRLARRQAMAYGLTIIGTVRLSDIAEKRGLISNADQLIQNMRDHGYRIAPKLLLEIRAEITEEKDG